MSEIISTSDGSKTLFSEVFDESYHSVSCGAISETIHKHIEPAFFYKDKFGKKIRILDVCFGLGYNAFSAMLYAIQHNLMVEIISPEIDEALPNKLLDFNYPQEFKQLMPFMHSVLQNGYGKIDNCSVKIVFGDFRQTLKNLDGNFDIVFQDPFSPKKNKALWSVEYFKELYKHTSDSCIVTTYSQATPVRLSMREAGFFVHDLPQQKPIRSGSIGSKHRLSEYKEIDLEHKLKFNKDAKPIYD